MICCVADNLLSLALEMMPRCVGHLLSNDVSRTDKVVWIVETLKMNGAVLVPYPCNRYSSRRSGLLLLDECRLGLHYCFIVGKGKGQVLAVALLTRELLTRSALQSRKWHQNKKS